MSVVKDAFSLWMNQHTTEAERIAVLAIENAQLRLRAGKKVARKAIASEGHRRYLQHTSNANAGEIFATHLKNVLST